MRRILVLLGLTALVAICALAVTSPQANAGCTVGFTGECHGDCVLLNWNIACQYPCTGTVTSILRRTDMSTHWTTMVTNPSGDSYSDCNLSGTYYYRLVLREQCGGLFTISTWDIGPIVCP